MEISTMLFNLLLFIEPCLLLAQEAEGDAKQPDYIELFGFPLMMMVMIYILLVVMPQSRERRGRVEFMNNLKKNDNVVTFGGIYGTIAGFSADGEQITLRVDENTRIRVRKSSIESVVKSEGESKKADDKSAK